MRYVVASHNGLFIFDGKLDDEWVIHWCNRGYYYGVLVEKDHFVAARRIVPYSKDSPTAFERYGLDGA